MIEDSILRWKGVAFFVLFESAGVDGLDMGSSMHIDQGRFYFGPI